MNNVKSVTVCQDEGIMSPKWNDKYNFLCFISFSPLVFLIFLLFSFMITVQV